MDAEHGTIRMLQPFIHIVLLIWGLRLSAADYPVCAQAQIAEHVHATHSSVQWGDVLVLRRMIHK